MPAIVAVLIEGLIAALSWLIRTQIGRWILSLLLFFGLNFATQHFVVQPFIDQVKSMAQGAGSSGGTFGAGLLAWLGVMNFDKAITMICSAVATRFGVNAAKVFLTRKTG